MADRRRWIGVTVLIGIIVLLGNRLTLRLTGCKAFPDVVPEKPKTTKNGHLLQVAVSSLCDLGQG
jgi:hypothetical protein